MSVKQRLVWPVVIFTYLFVNSTLSFASTINAASCSDTDVAAAISMAATTGDTVVVPAGTCEWDTQILINGKALTLQGAGIGNTIIQDSVLANAVFRWDLVTGQTHRMTGFEFVAGDRVVNETDGIIVINGSSTGGTTFRFDHNKTDHLNGVHFRPNDMIGSYDHNTCEFRGARRCVYIFNPSWEGVGEFGDNSWADTLTWGSTQFAFFEDNYFINDCDISQGGAFDGFRGTRAVIRFNHFTCSIVSLHGTESSGRNRGARGTELYANSFNNTGGNFNFFTNLRSGSMLLWGNQGTAFTGGTPLTISFSQDRAVHAFTPFGGAIGTNLSCGGATPCWDINNGIQSVCSGGTTCHVTGYSSSTRTVTVSDTLTPSALVGLTITKLSQCASGLPVSGWTDSQRNCYSTITSNTANTITFASNVFATGSPLTFTSGDTFGVYSIDQVLDGVGRSGGSLISGGSSSSPPSVPAMWNDQTTLPVLIWDNTEDGTELVEPGTGAYRGTIIEREHWFDDSDIDSGTSLPGTCTANVDWFWDTDAGSWNDGSNPLYTGQGTLYKCTFTDTWTSYYTPANYPYNASVDTGFLAFTTQPVKTHTGNLMTTFIVTAKTSGGSTNTSFTSDVGLTIQSCSGTLSGSTTVTAVAGVAAFSAVVGNGNGIGCSLLATASGVDSATSEDFDIGPNKVVFTVQPDSTYTSGDTATIEVAGQYASDSTTDTLANNSVTITINTVSGSCSLSGTSTDNLVAGVKSFSLVVTGTGSCNFTVASDGLTGETSNTFTFSTPTTPPVPGHNGDIAFTKLLPTGMTIGWVRATDDSTSAANLLYLVCRSTTNNVTNVAGCEAATIEQNYTADLTGLRIMGLNRQTRYYFNVVVKDSNGNKAAYTSKFGTTR